MFNALYWAINTLTTVGPGDIIPVVCGVVLSCHPQNTSVVFTFFCRSDALRYSSRARLSTAVVILLALDTNFGVVHFLLLSVSVHLIFTFASLRLLRVVLCRLQQS